MFRLLQSSYVLKLSLKSLDARENLVNVPETRDVALFTFPHEKLLFPHKFVSFFIYFSPCCFSGVCVAHGRKREHNEEDSAAANVT